MQGLGRLKVGGRGIRQKVGMSAAPLHRLTNTKKLQSHSENILTGNATGSA